MLSKQLLTQFANDVFTPLKNGECVSCMFVAGGGKRTIFKYFLSGIDEVKKIFGKQYKKTLFLFIDPDHILDISSKAYLQLILDNLLLKMKENKINISTDLFIDNPLFLIKKNFESLVANNWHIVLILNDFEFTLSVTSTIFLNLVALLSVDKSKISFVFLSAINLIDETNLIKMQSFK